MNAGRNATAASTRDRYAPFVIERRGIEIVPAEQRTMSAWRLGGLWGGALTGIGTLTYGLTIVSLGLSFGQAFWVITLGNLSFVLLSLCSLQGPQLGTTAMIITRVTFGRIGGAGLSLLNWLTVFGFEVSAIALSAFAGQALLRKAGVTGGTDERIVLAIIGAFLLAILPFFGHATIAMLLRWALIPSIAFFAIMLGLLLSRPNLPTFHSAANWETLSVAVAITISASGLAWCNQGNDFSRYVSPSEGRLRIVAWVMAGCYIPQTALMLLGALLATHLKGTNPFTDLPILFPNWFVIPYLIIAIVQILGGSSLDLYSSSLSLQAMGLPVSRPLGTAIDFVLGTVLSVLVVSASSFYTVLNDFLLFVIIWLAPWVGTFLADQLRRRGDFRSLHRQLAAETPHWTILEWRALISLVAGMGACALWLNAYPIYSGILSSRFNGSDFSIPMGLGVSFISYLLLQRIPSRRRSTERARIMT
jgi:nucleobase:cation symporter-1, NCS1 family